MAKTKKQRKRYKSPKAILRHTLAYFKANPENWTPGILRRKRTAADDGVALCALGGCQYFADGRKVGNTAIRYLAEAMGMSNAHKANLHYVRQYVSMRNDRSDGRELVLAALERATA